MAFIKTGFRKGINLGGWMSQCDYSEDRLNSFIKENDFAVIASWGREYGFHTYLLNAQDDDWKEKIIAYAERIRRMEHPETDETKDNL